MRIVGDVKLFARAVSGIDIKDPKSLVDEGKKQVGSGVVAIVGVTDEGKAGVVVGVTNDLTGRFNAVDLVRKAAAALGERGRRRPAGHGAGRRSGRPRRTLRSRRSRARPAAVKPRGREALLRVFAWRRTGRRHLILMARAFSTNSSGAAHTPPARCLLRACTRLGDGTKETDPCERTPSALLNCAGASTSSSNTLFFSISASV
ncbi:MAG: DHHA1 domain-containing protein [Xanthobacteraceae bacterium]